MRSIQRFSQGAHFSRLRGSPLYTLTALPFFCQNRKNKMATLFYLFKGLILNVMETIIHSSFMEWCMWSQIEVIFLTNFKYLSVLILTRYQNRWHTSNFLCDRCYFRAAGEFRLFLKVWRTEHKAFPPEVVTGFHFLVFLQIRHMP